MKLLSLTAATLLTISLAPSQNLLVPSAWTVSGPYSAFQATANGFRLTPQCNASTCPNTVVKQTVTIPATGRYMLAIYGFGGGTGFLNYTFALGNTTKRGAIEGRLADNLTASLLANSQITVTFTSSTSTLAVDRWQLEVQLVPVTEPVPIFRLYTSPGAATDGQISANQVNVLAISPQPASLQIPGITGVLGIDPSLMVFVAINPGSPSSIQRKLHAGFTPFRLELYTQVLSGNALGSAVRMY